MPVPIKSHTVIVWPASEPVDGSNIVEVLTYGTPTTLFGSIHPKMAGNIFDERTGLALGNPHKLMLDLTDRNAIAYGYLVKDLATSRFFSVRSKREYDIGGDAAATTHVSCMMEQLEYQGEP